MSINTRNKIPGNTREEIQKVEIWKVTKMSRQKPVQRKEILHTSSKQFP